MLPDVEVRPKNDITSACVCRLTSHRSARRIAVGALLILASSAAAASSLDLSQVQVYASESISGERSDYQGPTAAGGSIDLRDFDIDGDLTAGGAVRFARGQVHGVIRSPEVLLEKAFASRSRPTDAGDLLRLSRKLDDLGARLACATVTTSPVFKRGDLLGQALSMVRVAATRDIDVVDLRAEDLVSDGANRVRLVLTGTATSRLIIRVRGENPTIRNVGFAVQGGLTPGQVVFAFPNAKHLIVMSSGGAVASNGAEWGIPGSILAPQADLTLSSARVTGQVFVRSLAPIAGLPSGQINRLGNADDAGAPFVQSAAMEAIATAPSFDCQNREAAATERQKKSTSAPLSVRNGLRPSVSCKTISVVSRRKQSG